MNKLKAVVRSISPFTRGGKQQDQQSKALYEESLWQQHVNNLDVRKFLELFYRRYNPEKTHTIDFILEQFKNRENDMLLMLTDKYDVSREEVYGIMERAPKINTSDGTPIRPPGSVEALVKDPNPPRRKEEPDVADVAWAEDEEQSSNHHTTKIPVTVAPALPRPQGHAPSQVDSSPKSRRGSVSDFITGLDSLKTVRDGSPSGNRPIPTQLGQPGTHRSVNQSLKGVIIQVRGANNAPNPSIQAPGSVRSNGNVMSTPSPQFKNGEAIQSGGRQESPLRQGMSSNLTSNINTNIRNGNPKTLDSQRQSISAETSNQARLRAILDSKSEDASSRIDRPFYLAPKVEENLESSSASGESTDDEDDVEAFDTPEFKYDYPEKLGVPKGSLPKPSIVSPSRRFVTATENNGLNPSSHPRLDNGSHRSLNGKPSSGLDNPPFSENRPIQPRNAAPTNTAPERGGDDLARELERAKVALESSSNQKTDMIKLLEMIATNPGNIKGVISEFIEAHEAASVPQKSSDLSQDNHSSHSGPFNLGHGHHRGRFRESYNDTDNNTGSRQSNRELTSAPNRVLNLSDLQGRSFSLDQDVRSVATARSGISIGGNSTPHMRDTRSSSRRQTEVAKDAKKSGRYVPYHEPGTATLPITRSRSPLPGESRAQWTGASPSKEDLARLQKRSTTSTSVLRGRAGNSLGYDNNDSPSAWGENPRTTRSPSPSFYDTRGSRAPSPSPSVRSTDSFGSSNSRQYPISRYPSPSPSVRSYTSSVRSGSTGRIPGRPGGVRSASPSGGISGGGRLYFKETVPINKKVDDNTRGKLLDEQYKLAKKYLDHGLEQARLSQKMAELNLKTTTRRASASKEDAVASVEFSAGVDDWIECYDPRTKRNYYYSKSRKKSSWTRPEPEAFKWTSNRALEKDIVSNGGAIIQAPKSLVLNDTDPAQGEVPKSSIQTVDAESITSRDSRNVEPLASTRKQPAPPSQPSAPKRPSTPTITEQANGADSPSFGGGSVRSEKKQEWKMAKDEKSGRNYWYNRKTRETTWYNPYKTST